MTENSTKEKTKAEEGALYLHEFSHENVRVQFFAENLLSELLQSLHISNSNNHFIILQAY